MFTSKGFEHKTHDIFTHLHSYTDTCVNKMSHNLKYFTGYLDNVIGNNVVILTTISFRGKI